ncbi:MAG: AAA family ATPase [Erysipelotrichaceae bacterium]|nr:AAA family ATPase [Erysipelotrichaceae bacterium]
MIIYLRRITDSDTKKQIETTKEAYLKFFDGDIENDNGVVFNLEMNGNIQEFKVSKARGKANSYRFSSANNGDSLQTFIENIIDRKLESNEILKMSKKSKKYFLEIIPKDDKRYESLSGLIVNRDNTIVYGEEIKKHNKNNKGILPDLPRQLIYFGAPGTGKSNTIENIDMPKLLGDLADNYERVTFHPDYSYAHFVGTYKPVPKEDDDSVITYKYIPGPFLRTFVKAIQSINNNAPEPYLLIIEEINRANVAAVFGDIFQLLDRKDNESEYPIQTSEDMRRYLADELGGKPLDYATIRIPDNMFIWATMNSADQGVFPVDTAFKRRWDFRYISVNDSQEKIENYNFTLGKGSNKREVKWNQLRRLLNDFLLNECRANEDKLLGPFFIKPSTLETGNEAFIDVFKNKLLMYLFDDAAKSKRQELFSGCSSPKLFSVILEEFDNKGVLIFNTAISGSFEPIATDITNDISKQEE